ncbi:MAG: transcriptional repressor [Akkermansia sp.]|nr:transcriptional repressor [Akkermansia sp.]
MAKEKEHTTEKNLADKLIAQARLRHTRQRRAVLETVLQSHDHPNAAMIFERAAKLLPGISLATVYNCLEALAAKRVINQLNFDNGASRYCPNLESHAHVLDDDSQRVMDVKLKEGIKPEDVFDIPEGVQVLRLDAYLHGMIPAKS